MRVNLHQINPKPVAKGESTRAVSLSASPIRSKNKTENQSPKFKRHQDRVSTDQSHLCTKKQNTGSF